MRRRAAPMPDEGVPGIAPVAASRRAPAASGQGGRAVPRRAAGAPASADATTNSTGGEPAAMDPAAGPSTPASGFDLLSRMGHELRSPLSAILGFAQILRDDEQAPLSPLHAGMVRQIEASGLSLLGMVNDLVELSRMEAGRLALDAEGVDLTRLSREVCAQLAPQAAAGAVTVAAELPEGAVTVRTDRARLRHVLTNLLSHAIRYNRRGGRATLRLTVAAGRACIVVSDTGGGLTADTVQALFDPFARTTLDGSSLQGAGIGLLVARRLTEALGARLRLDVTPDVGTQSGLDLPLAEPDKGADPARGARRNLPSNVRTAGALRARTTRTGD